MIHIGIHRVLMFVLLMATFFIPSARMTAQRISFPDLPKTGKYDTIPMAIIPMETEWIGYVGLPPIEVHTSISQEKYLQWLRLERAVHKVYPYAKEAGKQVLLIRTTLDAIKSKKERKAYLKTKEKELSELFTEPMKKLSIYQGSILIKLINRETGNSCYELIKDYKGGFSAFFWESIARFFHNSLKTKYDPEVNIVDYNIEMLVREIEDTTSY